MDSRLQAKIISRMLGDLISKVKHSQPESCFWLCMIDIELQGKEASL